MTHFALIFRNSLSYVRRGNKVRWKVLTLAHPTVGQNLKSHYLERICEFWIGNRKLPQRFNSLENSEFFGSPVTSDVTRSVPGGRISTSDPRVETLRVSDFLFLKLEVKRNTHYAGWHRANPLHLILRKSSAYLTFPPKGVLPPNDGLWRSTF